MANIDLNLAVHLFKNSNHLQRFGWPLVINYALLEFFI